MRDGPCPECGSGEIYIGQGSNSQGRRDVPTVPIRAGGARHDLASCVCLTGGRVRRFVADRSRPGLAAIVAHSEQWRRAAAHAK